MNSKTVIHHKLARQPTVFTLDMSYTFRETQYESQDHNEEDEHKNHHRGEKSEVRIVPKTLRWGSEEEPSFSCVKPNPPPTVGPATQQQFRKDFDENSRNVDGTQELPRFDLSDIHLGLVLGKGSFAQVIEVKGFSIKSIQEAESNTSVNDDCDTDPSMSLERGAMVKMNGDNETARFALKRLHSTIRNDPHMLVQAIGDMATETRVLSSLTDHPHVIKLRGIARESDTTCRKDYFFLLDRMYDTLDRRIRKWRMRDQELSGIQRLFRDRKQTKRKQLWMDRLSFAYDLSSALAYLHSKHIIHRDLKPRNIGFDFQGKQFIIVLLR
jgi:hypothetical protein